MTISIASSNHYPIRPGIQPAVTQIAAINETHDEGTTQQQTTRKQYTSEQVIDGEYVAAGSHSTSAMGGVRGRVFEGASWKAHHMIMAYEDSRSPQQQTGLLVDAYI